MVSNVTFSFNADAPHFHDVGCLLNEQSVLMVNVPPHRSPLKRNADGRPSLPERKSDKRLACQGVSDDSSYGDLLFTYSLLYTFIGFFNLRAL